MLRRSFRYGLGLVIMLAWLPVATLAATAITHQDGPRYNPGSAQYLFGVCADTAAGESVHTQYSTDGTPVGDPPQSGTGSRVICTLTSDPGCASGRYWLCTIPDVRGATIWYRFYVLNASEQFTGLVTPAGSFYTGSTAVRLNTFDAQPPSLTLIGLLGAVLVAGLALAAIRLKLAHH